MSELLTDRPLVTVFGDHDALDAALNEELDRRGRMTHTITTPLGWLKSVKHAVIRINTKSGVQALQDLAYRDVPPSQVIAVCELSRDDATAAQVAELCRRCGDHHDVTLIWHAPFELRIADAHEPQPTGPTASAGELAITIADEVRSQESRAPRPVFVSQNFGTLG